VLEPGRFLVAEAGILVTRVLGTKSAPRRRFVVVDAGMNDLLRPALYGAVHPVAPVRAGGAPAGSFDVVGPVCESADFLARDAALPELQEGDLLAVFGTGAYGSTMSSNYNGRRRPAEVLVAGTEGRLVRRRERFDELWAAEVDLGD
jgi:diaminopimelate decarboxylase